MRIEHEDVRNRLSDLIDEQLQNHAPKQVADAWLATVNGEADASYVTRSKAGTGTRWAVLAVKGPEIVVIDGTSRQEYWSREDEDDAAEMRSHICTPRDVKALRLLEASDANPRGRHYEIRARWSIELTDGRTFTVPNATSSESVWARAESFIAVLRKVIADSAAGSASA